MAFARIRTGQKPPSSRRADLERGGRTLNGRTMPTTACARTPHPLPPRRRGVPCAPRRPRPKAVNTLDDPEHFDWHVVPRCRNSLPLREITLEQRTAAHALRQREPAPRAPPAGPSRAGTPARTASVCFGIVDSSSSHKSGGVQGVGLGALLDPDSHHVGGEVGATRGRNATPCEVKLGRRASFPYAAARPPAACPAARLPSNLRVARAR